MEIDTSQIKQVVFGVDERKVGENRPQPTGHPDGFPSAFKLDGAEKSGPRRKKMSLFKQKMMAKRKGADMKQESCCSGLGLIFKVFYLGPSALENL